jgi:hypothetical protein
MRTDLAIWLDQQRRLWLACLVLAGAPLHAQPAASTDPEVVFKSVALEGRVAGIRELRCDGGVGGHCDVLRESRSLGIGGRIELVQDRRLIPAIRAKLWGFAGTDIGTGLRLLGDPRATVFSGDPARNAQLVLRDQSGAVIAQLDLGKPLADMDVLFIGPAGTRPSFLVKA